MRDLAESQFQVEKVQQMADVWPRAKRVVALQEKASVAPLSMAADSPSPLLSSKDSIPTVSGWAPARIRVRERRNFSISLRMSEIVNNFATQTKNMKKTTFDWELYHKMYQFHKIASEQGVKLSAEKLRDHYEIPDRVARYYFFMVSNNYDQNLQRFNGNENRLIIPDVHAPFVKKGFLEHCVKAYHDYRCTKVTFLGDVLDNHYTSFWKADPDGMSAKDEVELAIKILAPWYSAFPEAEICIGNHDARIRRQAFDAGISEKWIKDYSEVIETPGWVWDDQFERMLYWDTSTIQGHWHTSSYTRWKVSEVTRLFAMQLGCGMDYKAYAAAYSKKSQKKPVIECGVVLDNGRIPIHLPMYLGEAA
jgi:hypothetical protein